MKTNSISRRHFAQLLGVGAACAVARPSLTLPSRSSSQLRTRCVRRGTAKFERKSVRPIAKGLSKP